MADSKLCSNEESSNADLMHCGICFAVIDKPKALPCLHTFCLECLTSWSESSAKKNPDKYTNAVSCPNCREDFPLPKGGVKELKTNFFVNKLKERNSIQKKLHEKDAKIPCTSCDASGNQAIGRCVECDDFLCKKCVDNHKSMRVLRHHHVLSLEELRAGKLTMHNLPEQEMCPKHTGEVLRFYCETCDEPMCRDCTVLDHPRSDHKQIDLKSAASERKEKLEDFFKQAEHVPKAIKNAIAEDESISKDLATNTENAITLFKKTCQKAEKEFTQNVRELEAKRQKEIEAHRESLQFQNARLSTALEMTKQVTQNGSEHDVATMYSSLSETMQQLCKLNPKGIRKSISQVDFKPSSDLRKGLGALGKLRAYNERMIISGQFTTGRGIAIGRNGNVAVATYNSGNYVKVWDESGTYQRQIQTSNQGGGDVQGRSYPWGLAISRVDGSYFITDENPYVKVFDADGNFKLRFSVQNPNGSWSHSDNSKLFGLAIDAKDRVFVGCYLFTAYKHNNYISIHNQNGNRISGFNVKLFPYFIAITQDDKVIASDHCLMLYGVHIYDNNGTHLHTFDNPPSVPNFYSTGLCIVSGKDNDEVLVATHTGPPAIYRYSMTGKYLGVFTKDVKSPYGIAFDNDNNDLVVCDNDAIKFFPLG